MNLPNKITLGRLVLAIGLFALLGAMGGGLIPAQGWAGWTAFVLFVVASATDWVDGFVARRYGMVTALGRILDPFVDKVLAVGTLVFLCAMHPAYAPPWVVVVILAREFLVSSLRGYMEAQGVSFGAVMPGKIKMVLQSIWAGTLLFWQAWKPSVSSEPGPAWIHWLSIALIWSTLAITLQSGAHYVLSSWRQIRSMPS